MFDPSRRAVPPDAKHQGGLNIFGERFGDYAQGIMYSADYK